MTAGLKSLLFLQVNCVLNKFGVSSVTLQEQSSASLWKYQDKLAEVGRKCV